ncbi:hypothetical protein [uncultured Methanobrevibacter sp.]|uniref:hypothetical protein n=1 Tax=uncultured Methanobrevibacter sp. TaxID=253161 RepID=UPI0025F746B2|nr:hypothetical protein [uncultured Methanobrevibacter sp.]
MNKKIFTIFALILLVASISTVSAFDLGDLFGSGKNETITLDGVKFNIPAGYKEDQSNTTNNRLNEFKKNGTNVTGTAYVKDSDAVGIMVLNYSNTDKTSDNVKEMLKENKTKIKDIEGSLTIDNGVYVFSYAKNDIFVSISAPSKEILSEFLIA